MTIYEALIIMTIFAAAVGVAAYAFGKQKGEIKAAYDRLTKLEEAAPLGYIDKQCQLDVDARLQRIELDIQTTREIVHAIYHGRYNPNQHPD